MKKLQESRDVPIGQNEDWEFTIKYKGVVTNYAWCRVQSKIRMCHLKFLMNNTLRLRSG